MQHQRFSRKPSLLDAGAFDQLAGMFRVFRIPDFPADDIPTEKIDYHVKVVKETFDRAVKIGDIPHPDLIGAGCLMSAQRSLLRFCGTSPVILHLFFAEDAVEGGLGSDICAFICQRRHDLAWRHAGILWIIDRIDHSLTFFSTELVCRFRMFRSWTPILIRTIGFKKASPTVISALCDPDLFACGRQRRSGGCRLIDQHYCVFAV